MNGYNPYAGAPEAASGNSSQRAELTTEQRTVLRRAVAGIVAQTESYLPEGYHVGSELSYNADGPRATVAVDPPAGYPVSAGFDPNLDDLEGGLEATDHTEVAQGLAASAALQVMNAVGDEFEPAGR
ncbi:DUF5811 family protein [Haloferacaceae archaeon DSL9]